MRRKQLATVYFLIVAVGIGGWVDGQVIGQPGAWTPVASMGSPRRGLATAVLDGKIYAIGGYTGYSGGILNTVEVYDPELNTWTPVAAMWTRRYLLAAAALNGKIYAIGGSSLDSYLDTVEVYDPMANTWTPVASMAIPRRYLAAVALNGKIYALGGFADLSPWNLKMVEVYDPVMNNWTPVASMTITRRSFAAVALKGKIYAVGGYTASYPYYPSCPFTNTVEVFDPASNTWTPVASMGIRREALAAATLSGRVYAAGGYSPDFLTYAKMVEVYDPSTDIWSPMTPMTKNREKLAAAALNGKVYAIGGYPGAETVEVYVPPLDTQATDLIRLILDLGLPQGAVTPLVNLVEAARLLIDKGNITAATDKLNTFIKKIEKSRGKELTDEQADALIAAAQRILEYLP
jgi:N-acetylneuraminic acid mutarotase